MARRRTVMFGGGRVTQLADTWEWDGTRWAARSPAHSPSVRREGLMAYDRRRWIEHGPSAPGDAYGRAAAYDAARDKVVVFGGNKAQLLADTWEWDGSVAQLRNPAVAPPARWNHSMAYDRRRDRVVLFGGETAGGNAGNTREWDGTVWEQRLPVTSPSPRYEAAMAWDSVRGRVLLFGGTNGIIAMGDTWEWDGTTWTELSPANRPSPRDAHAMASDIDRKRIVLYGGYSLQGGYYRDHLELGDTWEWTGSNWQELTPRTTPGRRVLHAVAAHTDLQRPAQIVLQ